MQVTELSTQPGLLVGYDSAADALRKTEGIARIEMRRITGAIRIDRAIFMRTLLREIWYLTMYETPGLSYGLTVVPNLSLYPK